MNFVYRYIVRGLFVLAGIVYFTGEIYSQDLRLLIGNREIFIESRQNQAGHITVSIELPMYLAFSSKRMDPDSESAVLAEN
jgi:hypothetical protein